MIYLAEYWSDPKRGDARVISRVTFNAKDLIAAIAVVAGYAVPVGADAVMIEPEGAEQPAA